MYGPPPTSVTTGSYYNSQPVKILHVSYQPTSHLFTNAPILPAQKPFDILFCCMMERYEILKDIGSGNFGVAKLVRDKCSGDLYAVKYIDRGQKVEFSFRY